MTRGSLVAGLLAALWVGQTASARDARDFDAPQFSVVTTPPSVTQGGVMQVKVKPLRGSRLARVNAMWGKAELQGVKWSRGEWLLLVPVAIDHKPGVHPLRLDVREPSGLIHHAEIQVPVAGGDFDKDELGVSRSFTEPNRAQRQQAAADVRAFQALWKGPLEPKRWRGSFAFPMDTPTTAKFGTYRTINGRVKSRHMGLDLRGRRGEEIRAINDGKVALARKCFYSGNTVVVDHGAGIHSQYFHMTRMNVEAGKMVRKGDLLGTVGDTGRVTGPHLHLGIKVQETYVDPLQLLTMDLREDPDMDRRRHAPSKASN